MSTKTTSRYLKRPTKVLVLNQTYKVEWVEFKEDLGTADVDKCIIQIAKGYPKATTADTFLHELIHCINRVMDITDSTTEEQTTTRLATGLTTVWKHNPKVFEWLHKQLS